MRSLDTTRAALRGRRLPLGVAALAGLGLAFATVAPEDPLPPVGSEGGPSRALDAVEADLWLAGRIIFDKDFTPGEGLGTPELNGDSCRACHHDPVVGGAGGLDLNVFRFGRMGPGGFEDLPGGQVASRLRDPNVPGREDHHADADVFEQRNTPTAFGVGLIDTIPDAEILSNEDPTDADGDGIFGVARLIDVAGETEVGRFGWKAQVPRVTDFVNDAMGGENGITVIDDGRGFGMFTDDDEVLDPELSQADHDAISFYLLNLAPPPRGGNEDDLEVQLGELLFHEIGCATCHVPTLQGAAEPVHLFSNLLLHDVLPDSFQGMEEPGAGNGMYRTPPLWGISKTAPYFHDGRHETLTDAILGHASEAQASSDEFASLPPGVQAALIAFLEDL